MLLWVDPDTGDLGRQLLTGLQVEDGGSFSTTLRVRADGGFVEVSGNPSRFGRLEAVFGLTNIYSCIATYNRLLRRLELPEFTVENAGFRVIHETGGETRFLQAAPEQISTEGATISRIDICENYATGGPEELGHYLRYLTTQRLEGHGPRHIGEMRYQGTVYFGKNVKNAVSKCYDKSKEIRDHLSGVIRRLKSKADEEQVRSSENYLRCLSDWCSEVGLARWECRLGTDWLRQRGAHNVRYWENVDLSEILKKYRVEGATSGATVMNWKTDLVDNLIADGLTERQSERIRAAVAVWMSGDDPSRGVSPRTFRGWNKAVRPYGIDMRQPLNVTTLPVRVREIQPVRVSPPSWYRFHAA